ncbi:hypothetical protein F5882DRAFT_386889 [Hyaloscypha sp. PMI_1271]|nr:hypothetical protein F5882DRAFT_386889 [Hyaloscypha sp. PMI_1271]
MLLTNVIRLGIPPENIRNSVFNKTKMLAFGSIILESASEITWNLSTIVDDVAAWLNNTKVSPSSKVGILSSPNFMELIKPCVGHDTMLSFQRMLYSQSLAYLRLATEDKYRINVLELRQIGAITGQGFLKFLDSKLRPQSLASCAKEEIQTLYLLVIGTVLAVGYSSSVAEMLGPLTQSYAMRDHLCQILAHFIIYLGSRLDLQFDHRAEQLIIEGAAARWHKEGFFEWADLPADDLAQRKGTDKQSELSLCNLPATILSDTVSQVRDGQLLRTGFNDFEPSFFPDFLHPHLFENEPVETMYPVGDASLPVSVDAHFPLGNPEQGMICRKGHWESIFSNTKNQSVYVFDNAHELVTEGSYGVNALSIWINEHSMQNWLDRNQEAVHDPPKDNQKMSQKKKIQRMKQRIDHRTNNRGMFFRSRQKEKFSCLIEVALRCLLSLVSLADVS